MNYVKNPSREQKREWALQTKQQEKQMEAMVQSLAASFQDAPEDVAEFLSFGSKFYRYSVRNNMLVYGQNPYATYVQSYKAWKDMGYSIKKGEKGIKVYVPVQATILKVGDKLVPLEQATKEQKIQYKAGELESITQTRFKLGTVFDIAQTTYPKELYPKMFFMGYPSTMHKNLVSGLTEYATVHLKSPVYIEDMKSIALRGNYNTETGEIKINEMLEDTQQLSTLAHEMGHAMMQHDQGKSMHQKELEADALGIMLESHYGIEPTDTRRRHLANNYRAYQQEYIAHPERESFGDVLRNVFAKFREHLPELEKTMEKYVPLRELERIQKQEETSRRIDAATQKQYTESNNKIYDAMKEQIQITDYATAHGFHIKRAGHYYTLAEHDSVRIDLDRNCFWRNSGIGNNTQGSVIDFAAAFVHGGDLHSTLKELGEMIGQTDYQTAALSTQMPKRQKMTAQEQIQQLQNNLPKRGENMHRVYAYLIQSRYVDQDIVQEFVNRKLLYQDIKGNCVFTARNQNGEIDFATFRGTLTQHKFLGDVAGSNYNRGFYIHNQADKLIVTESVIDAMSVMSILKGQGVDYKDYDYLVLAGTQKKEAILTHLSEQPKKEVLLALDHDLAGVTGMKEIQQIIVEKDVETQVSFHVPSIEHKDWNGDLSQSAKKFQAMDTIPFLENKPLPEIHYCAAQNTMQIQEKGFRMRGERHQYRLVELNGAGEIRPMDVNRNTIYFSEKELKGLVPPMYQLVSYSALEKRQQEIVRMQMPEEAQKPLQEQNQEEGRESMQEQLQESQKASQDASEPVSENTIAEEKNAMANVKDSVETIAVMEILTENGTYMAKIEIGGKEEILGIRKKEEQFFVESGYAFDDSLKEYMLDEAGVDQLKKAMGGVELKELPDGILFQADGSSVPDTEVSSLDSNLYLQRIQQQELQKNMPAQVQASMAVGLEL